MLTCIIVDDEKHCRESLEILINKYCQELKIVSICKDGASGLAAIQKMEPDIVFLDIAMPGMNGFQLLENLNNYNSQIIFTTAFNEYAVEAFRVNAVDYLMKPINKDELILAVSKANKRKAQSNTQEKEEQINRLIDYYRNQSQSQKISLPTIKGLELLPVDRITCCTGEANYSSVWLTDGSSRMISKNIKYLEEKLQPFQQFIRIHHSAIINLDHMDEYVKGKGGYVILSDGKNLNVSRQRKQELLKRIK